MKKYYLGIIALLMAFSVNAQTSKQVNKSEVIVCDEFHVTKTLSEIAASQPVLDDLKDQIRKESEDRNNRIPYQKKRNPLALPLPTDEDPAAQKTMGDRQAATILANWSGQSGTSYPPDPSGAAGPNHFVQAVNTKYQIFDKTGGSVTGGGPFTLGSLLFSSNDGDPIVMYDKYADKWVITEFKSSGNKVLFAVSKTNNPTGQYYTYQFTSPQFPDYEKFSIWSDGYYMTSNQTNQKIFVFERDSMLAGSASSRSINVTFTPPTGTGFFCPLPADADGQLPPAGTPCPIFSYEDDGWGTGHVDRINIFKVTTTWGTTPAATVTLDAQLPTQAFDASYNSSWNDIAQPGTTKKLDGIGGVFTYRAQYRRWTGYNTVVLNNGVMVNTTTGQRSIRWYELRQNTTTGQWSIYQQSTFAPDALNRWVGSIAMDDNGSIGLAYAVSGSTVTYPSIRFTGRLAGDTLNKMTFTEQEVATGNSAQTSTNRFGDYSHMTIDPVDGTIFWYTGEYITGGQPATKIFSFKLPGSTIGVKENTNSSGFVVSNNGNEIKVIASNLPKSDVFVVDLFDIKGRQIEGRRLSASAENTLEASFNSIGLAKGTYLVRIGSANTSFQKVAKVIVE
ncbi:MAG: T9SS type A sorting domain-containing protein [Bacteroidetes bacterium]|nr:T9SS type A sorting domain-containing protein [Bacteroidota bacterium]